MFPLSPPLDETIDPDQLTHETDHETIAAALNAVQEIAEKSYADAATALADEAAFTGTYVRGRCVVKGSLQTVTGTTLTDDSELLFAIGANENWTGKIVLHADSTVNADTWKFTVTGPAGAAGLWNAVCTTRSDLLTRTDVGKALASASTGNYLANTGTIMSVIEFFVDNGATAGNVKLQWARNSGTGDVRVHAGSYLLAFPA